jgi:hypothetical protein
MFFPTGGVVLGIRVPASYNAEGIDAPAQIEVLW